MANLEKLVKAFEALKVFQPGSLTDESTRKKDVSVTKKEKVLNCNIIADCICSNNLRNVVDFPKFLGIAMETFLMLCDDPESDVRMVADECLNRTIKTLLETNLGRLQVELYKEIKKNGNSRSLRAALWRFADMCHLIRPQKCRPYVVNLLPCISRICRRQEDTVQETLATAMSRMCPVLMGFTNDAEVKNLLKSFLPNLRSSSATCRRAAASALVHVCQYSRKPVVFFSWLLSFLLDMVVPVSDDRPVHTLLGALLALRHLLPHLATTETADQSLKGSFGVMTRTQEVHVSSAPVLQVKRHKNWEQEVYELLLYYSGHSDHNVVTASLETLHVLLRNSPPQLRKVLTTKGAINSTFVYEKDIAASMGSRSSSQGYIPSASDDLPLEDETDQGSEVSSHTTSGSTDDLDQVDLDASETFDGNSASRDTEDNEDDEVEDDMSESTTDQVDWEGLGSTNTVPLITDCDDGPATAPVVDVGYSGVEIGTVGLSADVSERTDPTTLSQSSSADTLSELKPDSPQHRKAAPPPPLTLRKGVSDERLGPDEQPEIDVTEAIQPTPSSGSGPTSSLIPPSVSTREGDIGSMTDKDGVPIVHCVRKLASQFLLTGHMNGLIADRQVRVSVKALALGCIGSALMLHPAAFLSKLHISSPQPGALQDIHDLLLYMSHSDPQLKGNTAVLVGNLLHAALTQAGGNYDTWVDNHTTGESVTVQQLVQFLSGLLEDDSSVATRLSLIALRTCLSSLLHSVHSQLGLKVLLALLHLRDNPYWLVKVELLELVGEIDFKLVAFLEFTCPDVKKGQHHFIGNLNLQEHILERVIFGLLGDEDGRVRHVAASTLVKVVPRLFYAVDNPQHDPVTAKARELTMAYLDPIIHDWGQAPGGMGGHLGPGSPAACGLPPGLGPPYYLPEAAPAAGGRGTGATQVGCRYSHLVESSLSRVVSTLTSTLQSTVSRHLMYGCLHALALLSQDYPVTLYGQAWCCSPPASPAAVPAALAGGGGGPRTPTRTNKQRTASTSGSSPAGGTLGSVVGGPFSSLSVEDTVCGGCGGGPLPLILSLLTSSTALMDLSAQQDALVLAGHVFAGAAYRCLRSAEEVSGLDPVTDEARWASLSDRLLVPLADQLVSHIARLLNVCAHVIEDQAPGPPQLKPSLPSLPNAPSLSPIKRKAKAMKDDQAEKVAKEAAATEGKTAGKADKKGEKEKEAKEDKNKKEGLGTFYSLPYYMKLFDVLKGAYSNYKLSLDLGGTDKFGSLLQAALGTFSLLLEVAGLPEVGKHAEELLGYLRAAVTLEATTAIHCVQQLLKALFGTNLASQWESNDAAVGTRKLGGKASRLSAGMQTGLYHSIFTTPYMQFSQCMSGATFRTTATQAEEESSSLISWLKKKAERKIPAVLKPGSKADKTSIASYIRLFEPLVIKALKQYTVTSSLQLQQQVLNLLAQLVQLRVNYCLLDSDQIFIGFVIKQFEFIEEGQIRHSETLIPHIFYFLVLLSYERYHSKSIIGMPKIIQLCDGIMASGQQPTTHAIPALQPIVYDLFVSRSANKADAGKDLDTQREVVVSMLVRLIQYYQVLEMLIIVLHQCHKESEDKWKRLSRLVIDRVLPLLAKQQVNLEHQAGLDVVHRLFESVAPSVFRPVDVLLKTLLAPPNDLSSLTGLQRWLCLVLASLRVLISQSKEEVVLSRLAELDVRLTVFSQTLNNHRAQQLDEETASANKHPPTTPENMIARFLLQVIGLVAQEICRRSSDLTSSSDEYSFLCQELAHLLLYVTHMFQSGLYRRVAMAAMATVRRERDDDTTPEGLFSLRALSALFREVASSNPTLTLQWCNLLILMNVDDQEWWSDILQTPAKYRLTSPTRPNADSEESPSGRGRRCYSEIVRRGGLILFCDYVCENLSDAEHMTWVIINHVGDVINLSHEPPVKDFISAIHRNSAASGLLIQAIHSRCENMTKASLVKKTLHCLEAIHLSQSGALLTLLVDKFLCTTHLAVARFCDMIACRRVEMLLAESVEESSSQLPLEDLEKLLQFMKTNDLTTRHARLASLLQKLRVLLWPESRSAPSPERVPPLAAGPPGSPAHTAGAGSGAAAGGTASATAGLAGGELRLNKEWYTAIVRDQCFGPDPAPRQCAKLLRHLDYGTILSIIMAKEFNLCILEECIALGTHLTLSKIQRTASQVEEVGGPGGPPSGLAGSPPGAAGTGTNGLTGSPAKEFLDPLLQAAQMTLFRHVNSIINLLPVPHRIINYGDSASLQEEQYREKMEDCLADALWCDSVFQLAAALLQYLVSLPMLPWKPDVPQESAKDICRFTLLCAEVLEWQLHHDLVPTSSHLQAALESLALVLQDRRLSDVMGQADQATWVCSTIRTVHTLLSSMLVLPGERLVTLPNQENQDDLPGFSFDDFHHVIRACDQISELVHCLKTHLSSHQMLPRVSQYLIPTLRNVIIGLARLPLVNSYARTPPLVWTLGWMPSPGGDLKTKLPPLPLEYLQEKDILREFIFRVNILGWTSRQQFEETWMSLLGVLNPAPLGEEEHASVEEDIDRAQTMVLAVRCITSLLVQSTLTPNSGNPSNSVCEHRPRDKPLAFLHTRCGRKLAYIRGIIEREIQAVARQRSDLDTHHTYTQWSGVKQKPDKQGTRSDVDAHRPYWPLGGTGEPTREQLFHNNVERELGDQHFSLGQMSIESIWGLVGMLDAGHLPPDSGSDTTTGTDSTVDSPRQIYPPVYQVSLPADVRERSALVSGLDIHSCLQLLLELYGQVVAGGPAAARVPLMQLNETIKSILALSDIFTERSQFEWMLDVLLEMQRHHPAEDELVGQYLVVAICKAAAVVGMDVAVADRLVKTIEASLRSTHLPTKVAALYGSLYVLEAGMSELVHQLLPPVTDYLLKQLTSITQATITSQQHVLLMWACTFYIIENYQEEIRETDFNAKMLQVAIATASGPEEMTPLSTYLAILRGLERLLLASVLTRQDAEALVKLSVDRLCLPSPQRALASLGLMLTCMYSGKSGDAWSPTGLQDPPQFPHPATQLPHDPESLIVAMERVTVLFDRIRKGLPYEARVVTQALPTFLADFFPPQDIMNKVIGEFLSSQQPHPQLMALVVFQVFENLIEKDQNALVRDWVMLSLSNFTQRTPVAMAIWSLTCFFISASTNPWLRALLPHVLGRMGRMESIDRRLFCLAALDLRAQLRDDAAQLRAFHATFQGVAQPDTAYADLMACCGT